MWGRVETPRTWQRHVKDCSASDPCELAKPSLGLCANVARVYTEHHPYLPPASQLPQGCL